MWGAMKNIRRLSKDLKSTVEKGHTHSVYNVYSSAIHPGVLTDDLNERTASRFEEGPDILEKELILVALAVNFDAKCARPDHIQR